MKFTIRRTSDGIYGPEYRQGLPPASGATRSAEGWEIEIPDLEALWDLATHEGEIIVIGKEEGPAIEIYDDWRE